MQDVRERIDLLNAAIADRKTPLNLTVEICHLQFRHIAELVTIGCLLALGDFKLYRSFQNSYNPKEVFKRLDSIWPHSFPVSTETTWINNEYNVLVGKKASAISRPELEQLWAKSGNTLHRLSIQKYFKQRQPNEAASSLEDVKSTTAKIVDLLDSHAIFLPSPKRMLSVSLSQPDCKVLAYLMMYGDQFTNATVESFRLL
jgi:hypothetical protein